MADSLHRRAESIAWGAAALSLGLGLCFLFIRSPLPWGWEGFDFYYPRALKLARDGVLETTDVPWGYVSFLAAHYRVFGDRPWIPLLVQVVLNATVPVMTYRLARLWLDERTAAVAALLAGVFSFNTLYAATQSSDAICNVLFLAGVLTFALACRSGRRSQAWTAACLLALAPQFRPNLLLFPFVLAAVTVLWGRRLRIPIGHAVALVVAVTAVSIPYAVRNYRVTGLFIPTSTHGATQLWYGSLEMGPYLNARTRNPRRVFGPSPLPYTTIAGKPIVITAESGSCPADRSPDVEFWTDRDGSRRRVAARVDGIRLQYDVPGQPLETTVYYRFVSSRTGAPVDVSIAGDTPFVYFDREDHTGDLDRHGDLLDVFDVARLVGHVLWGEAVLFADRLDADHDGRLSPRDLDAAVKTLLWELPSSSAEWQPAPDDVIERVAAEGQTGIVRFRDGSTFEVPRGFTRVTDLSLTRGFASQMAFTTRPLAVLATGAPPVTPPCRAVLLVAVNDVFYRREVDQMRRYQALAIENIRLQPAAFLAAAMYRAVRVFIILGSSDEIEARNFRGSALIYGLGTAVSVTAFVLFLTGAAISLRRRPVPWLLLLPPAYVSLTIAPFFTNMRYTITVQPFVFAVTAVTLVALYDRVRAGRSREQTRQTL